MTMHATVNAAKEVAQGAMGAMKGSRGAVLDAVKVAGEVVAFLRKAGVDNALRTIGLQRGPSLISSVGIFASGVVVGAGLGLVFAPVSGEKTREFLAERVRELYDVLKTTATEAATEVSDTASQVADQVSDTASKVASQASDMEDQVEVSVDEALQDAVAHPANGVVDDHHTKTKRRRHHADKAVS